MGKPRRRNWVLPLIWIFISGIVYFWLGHGLAFIRSSLMAYFGNVFLFVLGLLVWSAFFAQFILPVCTFSDRQKIFDRLIAHMSGGQNPNDLRRLLR
jgi:hypothetical protein